MSVDWDDLLMSSEDFFTTSTQTERLLNNKCMSFDLIILPLNNGPSIILIVFFTL